MKIRQKRYALGIVKREAGESVHRHVGRRILIRGLRNPRHQLRFRRHHRAITASSGAIGTIEV